MVGTFYAKPTPEKPSFVSVGDTVSEDTTVCLIEAMKIFNEIKAGQSGTIAKILIANGDAVEFGQPMLLIKPA
jgi:acetyl-CoA carboxylase biotin carboxyl carrier protein